MDHTNNNNNADSNTSDSFFTGGTGSSESIDNNNYGGSISDTLFGFESFVDPSMLLPDDGNFGLLNGNEFSSIDSTAIDSIPAVPNAIPPINNNNSNNSNNSNHSNNSNNTNDGNGNNKTVQPSLYEKLINPNINNNNYGNNYGNNYVSNMSPALYASSTSPYTIGSPSSLMMASSNEPSWMHSHRPRRRRSTYASPVLMPQSLASPPIMYMTPGSAAAGYMPFATGPMSPGAFYHQPGGFMMAPTPMSPMNVTVKLPMAPLTPTSSASTSNSSSSVKIPLVLPCHLQQQQQYTDSTAFTQNQAAPNLSKLQSNLTNAASLVSSGVASRCSSIAPSSSISSRSSASASSSSASAANWFTEMSVTKDRFLQDVAALDFGNVTVMELKQILRKFGLNSTGKKIQLVERIQEIANYLKAEGRKRVKISNNNGAVSADNTLSTISIVSAISNVSAISDVSNVSNVNNVSSVSAGSAV